jgi:uncharacterized membrane protein
MYGEQAEDNRTAVNIGDGERLVSGLVGAWMVTRGLAKPAVKSFILAGSGMVLVYRAVTGRSRLYRKLHISGSIEGRRASASVPYQTGVKIEEAVTIAKSPSEVYQFWKNPENLPRFMTHVQSVSPLGPNRSHWIAKGRTGTTLEWDMEIINDQPGALIGWQSSPESHIRNAGSVTFRPLENGRGTEVKLTVEYKPAGGPLGAGVAALFGKDPKPQMIRDLRRLKQLMETGVITTAEGQPPEPS